MHSPRAIPSHTPLPLIPDRGEGHFNSSRFFMIRHAAPFAALALLASFVTVRAADAVKPVTELATFAAGC